MTYTQGGYIYDDDGRLLTRSIAGGEPRPEGSYSQNGQWFDPDGKLLILNDGSGVPDGGDEGQVLVKASDTDGDATWGTIGEGGSPVPDADGTTKGLLRLTGDLAGTATAPAIAAGVIVNADVNASAAIAQSKISGLTTDLAAKAASTDTRFPTTDQKAALAGTSGSPSASNPLVTNTDPRLSVDYVYDADEDTYVEVAQPTRRFLGAVDPADAGFTLRDGDTWDPSEVEA